MTTAKSSLQPIQVTLGVQPTTDRTRLNTNHYTFADKIRSWQGSPQVIGGWQSFPFEYGDIIDGKARTLYSLVLQNTYTSVVGTHKKFYAINGQELVNITPLLTATTTIANSIKTDYATLGNNPITTTIGTGTLVVADTDADKYNKGDIYTLSGSATVNGISDTVINTSHVIRSIGTGTITIIVSGTASSSGSGGGASVVKSTGRLTFTAAAHGQSNDVRVKITGAATTGGVVDTDINAEFIVRNVDTNTFDVMTAGTASSAVTGGGGASTAYQKQLATGNENESVGIGYGLGLYGKGLFGVSKSSTTGRSLPRIWYCDRFGDTILATPGNQGAIYSWQGDTSIAPALLTNAPTDINYMFVSDNVVVTFGYQDIPNQIFASDQGDATNWTASSLNHVYQDVIEGAERFISHVPVLGINLIFTPNQTYRFSKIDLNAGVWEIKLLDNSIGIISPLARVSVNNTAFWMARNNFYMWSGGNINIIPSNDQDQCTALNYVFSNINTGQLSKCFGWYNSMFNEVWFHYPSAASNECDRVVRVSLIDKSWWIDTFDRTCAEAPFQIYGYPRMISSSGVLYNHETGTDADGSPLEWTLTTNLRTNGKNTVITGGIVPDSTQTGNLTFTYNGYLFPQSQTPTFTQAYTITPTTERVTTQVSSRYWTYTWAGTGSWNMGQWFEYVQAGAPN